MIRDLQTLWQGKSGIGYSETEIIIALQLRQRKAEDWFYRQMKRYFDENFNLVFFDQDKKQEIFQSAFLKLWTEIENERITVIDDKVCRQQRDGTYSQMTCSMKTFMIAFAKMEYRELVRSVKEEYVPEIYDDVAAVKVVTTFEESAEEQKRRIVDECIHQMSPRCVEILTLFYYENKSLDEILSIRGDSNSSKNGLKTAKNKCMNTLRTKVADEMKRCHIII